MMDYINKTQSIAESIAYKCGEIRSINSTLEWIAKHESFIIDTHRDISYDNPFLAALFNYERVKKEQELRELKKRLIK